MGCRNENERRQTDRPTWKSPVGEVTFSSLFFWQLVLSGRSVYFLTNIAFASLLFKSMVARHQSPRPNSYQSMLHRCRQLADKGSSLSHLLFCQWAHNIRVDGWVDGSWIICTKCTNNKGRGGPISNFEICPLRPHPFSCLMKQPIYPVYALVGQGCVSRGPCMKAKKPIPCTHVGLWAGLSFFASSPLPVRPLAP